MTTTPDLNTWCRELFCGPHPTVAVLYADGSVSTFTTKGHPLTFLADPPELHQPVAAVGLVDSGRAVDKTGSEFRVTFAMAVGHDTTAGYVIGPDGLHTIAPESGATFDAMVEWLQACPAVVS